MHIKRSLPLNVLGACYWLKNQISYCVLKYRRSRLETASPVAGCYMTYELVASSHLVPWKIRLAKASGGFE